MHLELSIQEILNAVAAGLILWGITAQTKLWRMISQLEQWKDDHEILHEHLNDPSSTHKR